MLPTLLLLSFLPPFRLFAQCPDGTPPPCGSVRRPSVTPDPDVVVVLPFRVVGTGDQTALLRDGMVDLVYIALDGFAGWRFVDPGTVLSRAGSAAGLREPRQAARFARELGAGSVITGTAVSLGSEVRLQAELYDAITLERRATVQLQGDPSRLAALADSLAWSLARYRLREHPGAVRRSLEEYTTGSIGALRAYLAAEQLSRRGEWAAALDSLKRAASLDSTFGLAWYGQYRVAVYGGVGGGESEQEAMIERGLRSLDRLPPRQRDLLLAVRALQQGLRTDALQRETELATRYPTDPDISITRGEILFHLGLPSGAPPRLALAAFEEAIAVDARSSEAYQHAIELRGMTGDSTGAMELLQRIPVRATRFQGLEFALRAAFRGEDPLALIGTVDSANRPAIRTWARNETLRILNDRPDRALALADSFSGGPTYPSLVARGRYREAWLGLQHVLQTRPSDIPAQVNAAAPVGLLPELIAERRQASSRLAATGGLTENFHVPLMVAWWAALDGDSSILDSASAVMISYTPRPYLEALATGLRGLAAMAQGDTARAVTLLTRGLESRYQLGMHWSTMVPTVPFALQLARLHLAAGRYDDAQRSLADALNLLAEELPYRAEAEELLGQIAEQRADTATAIHAYRNFIALWEHADPELQPRVEQARVALRRLEK